MRRVRWVLFIAAGVCLLFGRVMYAVQQDAARSATGLIANAVTEAQAEVAAATESATDKIRAIEAEIYDSEFAQFPIVRAVEWWEWPGVPAPGGRSGSDLTSAESKAISEWVKIKKAFMQKRETLSAPNVRQAVRQSVEYIALERRQDRARIGYVASLTTGGLLGVIWFGSIITLLLRFTGIAYHKTVVVTLRAAIRSSRAVRKHVRDIVDEATKDE